MKPDNVILITTLLHRGCYTKYHNLRCLNSTHSLSHRSGSQRSKVKVGFVPSEGYQGKSEPDFPLASESWLGIFGVPWLVDASLHSLFLFHMTWLPVYVCVCVWVFIWRPAIGIKAYPIQNDLILTWLHLQRVFPKTVTLTGNRWTWIWGTLLWKPLLVESPCKSWPPSGFSSYVIACWPLV